MSAWAAETMDRDPTGPQSPRIPASARDGRQDMPSLTRWVKAQRFRAPANALASPANQRAGKGSPSRYVNRRAWESRLAWRRRPTTSDRANSRPQPPRTTRPAPPRPAPQHTPPASEPRNAASSSGRMDQKGGPATAGPPPIRANTHARNRRTHQRDDHRQYAQAAVNPDTSAHARAGSTCRAERAPNAHQYI